MRDAFNLAWKLALVVNGKAGEALLDSYQQERRDHAKAMIDLSVTAGNVLAPPKRWHGAVRDGFVAAQLSAAGQTLLPRNAFQADAAVSRRRAAAEGESKNSPVGKMFIQPKVTLDGR
jgi:3-(3-hydroxy-phenyl)propionate hydroxylase